VEGIGACCVAGASGDAWIMQQPPVIDRTVYATSSTFADDARDSKVVFCGKVTDMGRWPGKGAHLIGYVCPVGNFEGLVLLAN
jgi:hypothetical protein